MPHHLAYGDGRLSSFHPVDNPLVVALPRWGVVSFGIVSDMGQCSLDVGVSPRVSVRLPPDMLAGVDGLRSEVLPLRSDVVRAAIAAYITHPATTTERQDVE